MPRRQTEARSADAPASAPQRNGQAGSRRTALRKGTETRRHYPWSCGGVRYPVTPFQDRQLDDHANRRSAQERTCPACGRLSALKRMLENDGSLNLACRQEQCDYRRVVPLEHLTAFFLLASAAG